LAVLINSTRSKKRRLALTEVAKSLAIATGRLGSYQTVAERIGLSSKMLRQFSYVDRLSKAVRRLFEQRKLNSVDAAAHLAMLPLEEQDIAARELVSGGIDTIDLRAVTQLRRHQKGISIAEVLERVKASKTKQEYVAEFVVRGERDRRKLLETFEKHIPSREIVRLVLNGAFGRLVLTASGKRQLFNIAKRLGCTAKNVIPHLLSSS